MNPLRGVVVQEETVPLEGWNDAIRGKVVWRTLLSGDRTPSSQRTLGVTELELAAVSPHFTARSRA